MLQMGLKCPHLLSKQAENYILASDWQYYDILDIPPSEGAQGPPPHPGTEIPNMALEWTRPIQIHSLI